MLHKNVPQEIKVVPSTEPSTHKSSGLSLVPSTMGTVARRQIATPTSSMIDLAVITSRRCSSFFAEAAVLVLVFGILDFFILKGRIDLNWIVGALAISLVLLGASIAMDFSAHRWMKAHP